MTRIPEMEMEIIRTYKSYSWLVKKRIRRDYFICTSPDYARRSSGIAGEIWMRRVTLRGCIMVNGTSNGDSHRKRSSLSPSLSLLLVRSRASNTDTLCTRQGRKFLPVLIVAPSRVFVFFKPLRLYHGGYTRRTSARRTLKRAIKPYRRFSEGICTSGWWAQSSSRECGQARGREKNRRKGAIDLCASSLFTVNDTW